jgi:hypothetical protein
MRPANILLKGKMTLIAKRIKTIASEGSNVGPRSVFSDVPHLFQIFGGHFIFRLRVGNDVGNSQPWDTNGK